MKINWKVLVALVLIVVVSVWAFDSLRSRSYSGANLTFGVGSGPVTVTNSSDVPVAAQLVGAGARSFSVSSVTEGMSGSSVRQGTGNGSTQLFELMVPPGVSVFTINRGTEVNFVTSDPTVLEATAQPVTDGSRQTMLAIAAVVILGALFFMSRTTNHRWLAMLRGNKPVALKPVPSALSADGGQGRAIKSYGDSTGD